MWNYGELRGNMVNYRELSGITGNYGYGELRGITGNYWELRGIKGK